MTAPTQPSAAAMELADKIIRAFYVHSEYQYHNFIETAAPIIERALAAERERADGLQADLNHMTSLHALMLARAAATAEQLRVKDDALEDVLVILYRKQSSSFVAVADLCDEILDRSGALLGRIRNRSAAPPAQAGDSQQGTQAREGGGE